MSSLLKATATNQGSMRSSQHLKLPTASADSVKANLQTYGLNYPSFEKNLTVKESDELDAIYDPSSPFFERTRPRTLAYHQLLPFPIESKYDRMVHLSFILRNLYISIMSLDPTGTLKTSAINFNLQEEYDTIEDSTPRSDQQQFSVKSVSHWTKELRSWMSLKFDMPLKLRIKLIKVYYAIALMKVDNLPLEKVVSMFIRLSKDKNLMETSGLILDHKPIVDRLKQIFFPQLLVRFKRYDEGDPGCFIKLATAAKQFFTKEAIPDIMELSLSNFNPLSDSASLSAISLISISVPFYFDTESTKLNIIHYFPTLFHVWSLRWKSFSFECRIVDVFSSISKKAITDNNVDRGSIEFGPSGLYTDEQMSFIFTAILRLLSIPISNFPSPYIPEAAVINFIGKHQLDRMEKSGCVKSIAHIIVYSIGPQALNPSNGVLTRFKGLLESIITFFHPSNFGSWTKGITQLLGFTVDLFVQRWNDEQQGNIIVPEKYKLNAELKKQFVLAIRPAVFLGIHSKNESAANSSLSALQGLGYLEPDLILPPALKEIYSALSGISESHRTVSALKQLRVLARFITTTPVYRIHLTTLLTLILPAIDSNDLLKSSHALHFLIITSMYAPFYDLSDGCGTDMAQQFILAHNDYINDAYSMAGTAENIRTEDSLEPSFNIDEETEINLLNSSTGAFESFLSSFIDRLVLVIDNLPDLSKRKSRNSMESKFSSLAPLTVSTIMSSASPELRQLTIDRFMNEILDRVRYPAMELIAPICGALIANAPDVEKTWKYVFRSLNDKIREEIEENGAGKLRSGKDISPIDQPLIWYIYILSTCARYMQQHILSEKEELLNLSLYLMRNLKGSAVSYASHLVHQVLVTLTKTENLDNAIVSNKFQLAEGITNKAWELVNNYFDRERFKTDALDFKWYIPQVNEVSYAVEFFTAHVSESLDVIKKILSADVSKEVSLTTTSDELTSAFNYICGSVSGIALLLDSTRKSGVSSSEKEDANSDTEKNNIEDGIPTPSVRSCTPNDEECQEIEPNIDLFSYISPEKSFDEYYSLKRLRLYPTGYFFNQVENNKNELYTKLHNLHDEIGQTLHLAFDYLRSNKEGDVSLYHSYLVALKIWFADVGAEKVNKSSEFRIVKYSRLIQPHKIPGIAKPYPRGLLTERMNAYYSERLIHNLTPRTLTSLDRLLLKDIVISSMSNYQTIRREASSTLETVLKVVTGSHSLVVNTIINEINKALLDKDDWKTAESGIRVLNIRSLKHTISRNAKHLIDITKTLNKALQVDYDPLTDTASHLFETIDSDFISLLQICEFDKIAIDLIRPCDSGLDSTIEKIRNQKSEKLKLTVTRLVELRDYLIQEVKNSHWRISIMNTSLLTDISCRFGVPTSGEVLDFLINHAIDPHPEVSNHCFEGMKSIVDKFNCLAANNYNINEIYDVWGVSKENTTVDLKMLSKISSEMNQLETENTNVTFLFDKGQQSGWLLWPRNLVADAVSAPLYDFNMDDELLLKSSFSKMTKEWLQKFVSLRLNETNSRSPEDRPVFRQSLALLYSTLLEFVIRGFSSLTFDEYIEVVQETYISDDRYCHCAVAELCGGMILVSKRTPNELAGKRDDVIISLLNKVFADDLSPDNFDIWHSFSAWALLGVDFRRIIRISRKILDYKIDRNSSAAFKDSSRLHLVKRMVSMIGWYQNFDGLFDDCWSNINHPYQAVSHQIGGVMTVLYSISIHESYLSLDTLANSNANTKGRLGLPVYQLDNRYATQINNGFKNLEKWRINAIGLSGQKLQWSDYMCGSRTTLNWLFESLNTVSAGFLEPYVADYIIPFLLKLSNTKEITEIEDILNAVFKSLGNLAYPQDSLQKLINVIIEYSTTRHLLSTNDNSKVEVVTWHQKRMLLNLTQAIYFRQLFLLSNAQKKQLIQFVSNSLFDHQLEVRTLASDTISGIIRCSPKVESDSQIPILIKYFRKILKTRSKVASEQDRSQSEDFGIKKHGATLGLCALVEAFPYDSPPPPWIPKVLTIIANKCCGNPGIVGKSAKSTISNFKKTRQDTWHIDSKIFTSEQLEDLEGVLWKSYFA